MAKIKQVIEIKRRRFKKCGGGIGVYLSSDVRGDAREGDFFNARIEILDVDTGDTESAKAARGQEEEDVQRKHP